MISSHIQCETNVRQIFSTQCRVYTNVRQILRTQWLTHTKCIHFFSGGGLAHTKLINFFSGGGLTHTKLIHFFRGGRLGGRLGRQKTKVGERPYTFFIQRFRGEKSLFGLRINWFSVYKCINIHPRLLFSAYISSNIYYICLGYTKN